MRDVHDCPGSPGRLLELVDKLDGYLNSPEQIALRDELLVELRAHGVKGRRIDGDQPLPDLILQLHRDGLGPDEIAAALARLGRDSEADAAGISIAAVLADGMGEVGRG